MDFDLSEEDVQELMETFCYFDEDGDNMLSSKELAKVFRAVGQNPTEKEIKAMMESVDDNKDELLSFEEYARLLQKHRKDPSVIRAELIQAFHKFDKDRTGNLDRQELRWALTYCGEQPLREDEADELLNLMDKDGDKTVSAEEFVDFLFPLSSHDIRQQLRRTPHRHQEQESEVQNNLDPDQTPNN